MQHVVQTFFFFRAWLDSSGGIACGLTSLLWFNPPALFPLPDFLCLLLIPHAAAAVVEDEAATAVVCDIISLP
jgi:hypothetical protein